MRIITVDNGNTNPHAGIFENARLSAVIPLDDYVQQDSDFVVASSVGKPLSVKLSFDLKTKRHTKSNPNFFDMPVEYAETLGDDRLMSAYYIFKKQKMKTLLIDAGTFITMDVVSAKGFEGGFIFPGIKTFLSSYGKGAQLPVLNEDLKSNEQLPHSTEAAILGAKEIYLSSVLEGIIKKTMPEKIVITGGAGHIIEKKLKELNLKVQLESDPHLIHSALFLIAQTHLLQA
jgi:type III pantothenate kinase